MVVIQLQFMEENCLFFSLNFVLEKDPSPPNWSGLTKRSDRLIPARHAGFSIQPSGRDQPVLDLSQPRPLAQQRFVKLILL